MSANAVKCRRRAEEREALTLRGVAGPQLPRVGAQEAALQEQQAVLNRCGREDFLGQPLFFLSSHFLLL